MGKDAYEELDMVDKMISCRGKGDVDIEILSNDKVLSGSIDVGTFPRQPNCSLTLLGSSGL